MCGYCTAQQGEEHTTECQVFRMLEEDETSREDPYSAAAFTIVAAWHFARMHEGRMSDKEYEILHHAIDKLIEGDPYLDAHVDRSTL